MEQFRRELWFTEQDHPDIRNSYRVKGTLYSGRSEFQTVEVIDTEFFGRMMLIDGLVMITDRDEFVYHEMISHIPMCLHNNPERVVVIGGGDGGTLREIIKHDTIKQAVLCEIDQMVIDAAEKFFPATAAGFHDPRVKICVGDGIAYMKNHAPQSLDLVFVDSTDPFGPGEGLFSSDFYRSVARALKPGGLMVAQSESPWHKEEQLRRIRNNISAGFSHARTYTGAVPTYPFGFWSWTVAAQTEIDPAATNMERFMTVAPSLKYLTKDLLTGAFAIPKFLKVKLGEA